MMQLLPQPRAKLLCGAVGKTLLNLPEQIEDGRTPTMHVRRVKNGRPSQHPIRGDEMRALRTLPRTSPYVFTTERGGQFTADAINRQIKSIANRAGFQFPVHAHMLRHACGFKLANDGHDTRSIRAWLGTATYCPRTFC